MLGTNFIQNICLDLEEFYGVHVHRNDFSEIPLPFAIRMSRDSWGLGGAGEEFSTEEGCSKIGKCSKGLKG